MTKLTKKQKEIVAETICVCIATELMIFITGLISEYYVVGGSSIWYLLQILALFTVPAFTLSLFYSVIQEGIEARKTERKVN